MSESPEYSFLHQSIDDGRVVLLNVIARGRFGTVYQALGPGDPDDFKNANHPLPSRIYAVKELSRNTPNATKKEVLCHTTVAKCPDVLKLYHVIEEKNATYLVTDYHPNGDLCSYLEKRFSMFGDSDYSKRVYLNILDAVRQCHDRSVYHQDLKPQNLLMRDMGMRVVLSDFGLSTRKRKSVGFRAGSPTYMSPECFADLYCSNPFQSDANDVWSLGVILCCIYFGNPPWKTPSVRCTSFTSFLLDPDYFLRRYPITIEFHHLLRCIFTVDPAQRISLGDLLSRYQNIQQFRCKSNDEVTQTRVQHLRPLKLRLIRNHVRRELSPMLDADLFLSEQGLDPDSEDLESEIKLWTNSKKIVMLRHHHSLTKFDAISEATNLVANNQEDEYKPTSSIFKPSDASLGEFQPSITVVQLPGISPSAPQEALKRGSTFSTTSEEEDETSSICTRSISMRSSSTSSVSSSNGLTPETPLRELVSEFDEREKEDTPDGYLVEGSQWQRRGSQDAVAPSLLHFMDGRFGTFAGAFHKHQTAVAAGRAFTPPEDLFGKALNVRRRGKLRSAGWG